MFKRKVLQRFNIYLGLFAILLISICPVITQTIALLGESSQNTPSHAPSLNHFECASQFYKENHLNPSDFLETQKEPPLFSKNTSNRSDDVNSIVNCGYCDLLHTASILVAFYTTILETPKPQTINRVTDPYILSLNYWSTLSRAPPSTKAIV